MIFFFLQAENSLVLDEKIREYFYYLYLYFFTNVGGYVLNYETSIISITLLFIRLVTTVYEAGALGTIIAKCFSSICNLVSNDDLISTLNSFYFVVLLSR